MGEGYRMLGFAVIVVLYAVVGLMAAAGAISITRRILGPRAEEVFYGVFLILIAGFYLAFVAYFGNAAAWPVETAAVVVFALIGLFGVRLPVALVAGYPLHGLWDLLHELQAQGDIPAFGSGQLTAIPLAYGVFCAAFDVYIAAYAHARRAEWSAAWEPQPEPQPQPEPRPEQREATPPA
jgi:RsiW-degrading membrane proteinase PrsW (M82 family)